MLTNWPYLSVPDKNKPGTWVKHIDGMCEMCYAICCTMPLEISFEDVVNLGWAFKDEVPRKAAKRLIKENLIEKYRDKTGLFTLRRKTDHSCILLNENRQCTVYNNRPKACREFPKVSSRPGYCPAVKK